MRYLLIVLSTVLFFSCNNKQKEENAELKQEIITLQQENMLLKSKQRQVKSTIVEYQRYLEEIDENLKQISESNNLISFWRLELSEGTTVEERISQRMAAISVLLKNSRLKIIALDNNLNELRRTSSDQSKEIYNLERRLKNAARELIDQENEFNQLAKSLENEIDNLEAPYEEQLAVTNTLLKIINRAYYCIGTKKELMNKGIVNSEGGFIGIGEVKVLNANSSEDLFQLIEKNNTETISLPSKRIKLITEHPQSTFTITEQGNSKAINILDKKAFWKLGNYLVVQID